MQIPLDYYRILGVPIQATAEQLQQAYCDRAQQLPQYHYSEAAIAARKQLLETAYNRLSDLEQRQAYNATFLAKTDPSESQAFDPLKEDLGGTLSAEVAGVKPTGIEIQDDQLTGALLLLQELGEYELVLQLGCPYLRSGILDLKHQRSGSVLSEADIVLSVALCDLELGREQWQQGQYEKAAQSLQAGLELLLREGLFSSVQSEIRTDLDKLRPYRVLELLAPTDNQAKRRQGLLLLKDMLEERGGIDGSGNDHSGLSVHEFLRFIQQLRSYLSVTEQQELFEREARRPSAVATYLAVYALVAQGYEQRQPALIRRAKAMLLRLSTHQDVYLEQAVCTLLLGQPEAANQILELSHEYDSLAFIREHSVDSPDLIPGLYLYTERWLQDEVFPYFRDLADQTVDLKAYFADKQVQSYLETLMAETTSAVSSGQAVLAAGMAEPAKDRSLKPGPGEPVRGVQTPAAKMAPTDRAETPARSQPAALRPEFSPRSSTEELVSNSLDRNNQLASRWQRLGLGAAQRLIQPQTEAVAPASTMAVSSPSPRRLNRRGHPGPATPSGQKSKPVGGPIRGKVGNQSRVRKPPRRSSLRLSRPGHQVQTLGFIALGLLVVGALTATIVYALRELQSRPTSPATQELPLVELEQPPLPIPIPQPQPVSQPGDRPTSGGNQPLNQESVRQLVQSWQATKAVALGPQRTTDGLAQVLTGPALTEWNTRAQQAKANDWYWQYKLNRLNVNAVNSISSNQASAVVTVNETANFFQQGQRQSGSSYADTYQVRYNLVRQKGQWLIREMKVL